MNTTAVRPQRNATGMSGRLCKAFEFDYMGGRFYVQESDGGYAVLEETWGYWAPVQPQRRQMIVAEFERARQQRRM